MTWPVTPNPGIHNEPTGRTQVPGPLLTPQQVAAWAVELPLAMTKYVLTALFNALEAEIPPQLLGPLENAETALDDVGSALQTAFTQIPGVNLAAGPLNSALTIGGEGMALSTVESSVSAWTAFLAQIGASSTAQFGSALAGLMPAMIDNFDGTVTYIGNQATDNGDGTITFANQVGSQAINSLIDAGDGTIMSVGEAFANAVAGPASILQSGVQGLLTGIQNSFTPSAPVANATAAQANEAMATISAQNAAAQERLATIGNGAEMVVDVNFADYSNGAMPSNFTNIHNFGTAPTISDGVLTVTGQNLDQRYQYNVSDTLTDYQQISGTFPLLLQGSGGSSAILLGRIKDTNNSVFAMMQSSGVVLTSLASGNYAFSVVFADTFSANAQYSLLCGDPTTGDPYRFTVTKDGVPLVLAYVVFGDGSQIGQLYYTDTARDSVMGASNRACGLGVDIASGTNGTAQISSFSFRDTVQSSPSVLVATQESTTSTTYTDLTTISDEVVVNIGSSGMALVTIGANISNNTATGDSYMSFAASGANTIAASDANAIMYQAWAAGAQGTLGRTIVLTDLSTGLTTFKAKYRSSGSTATFANRSVGVVAL